MNPSMKRYYEKNREAITARMRERYAEKKAAEESTELTPEEMAKWREAMREKYHNGVANKTRRQIEIWVEDDRFEEGFKVFLRDYCLKDEKYKCFTPKMMEMLYAVGSPVSALIAK